MYKVCKISDTCKRNAYVYGTPLVCHMFVIHVNCHIDTIDFRVERLNKLNVKREIF